MITKTRIVGFLTTIICIALVAFGVVGGLMPQLASVDSTNQQIEDTNTRNEASVARLAVLEQAKQNSNQLDISLKELRKALPDTAASAAWLDELHQMEKTNKSQIAKFEIRDPLQDAQQAAAAQPTSGGETGTETSTGAQTSSTEPLPIPVVLEAVAKSDKDALAFVADLQLGSRFFLVKKAEVYEDVSSGSGTSAGKIWRIAVSGLLYALPEPK